MTRHRRDPYDTLRARSAPFREVLIFCDDRCLALDRVMPELGVRRVSQSDFPQRANRLGVQAQTGCWLCSLGHR